MMPARRMLVAGIGNIFFGDDGFGVEVARRLKQVRLPDGVVVADYGVSGVHLAYDLAEYDSAILVDATPGSGPPGTVRVIEPELEEGAPLDTDGHALTLHAVLSLVRRIGGAPARLLIVGCVPASLEEGIGLSTPVADSVDRAVERIVSLATEITGASRATRGMRPCA